MSHVRTHPHECEGHLKFVPGENDPWSGLSPYWAISSLALGSFDGHGETDVQINGDTWHVELFYSKSAIAPRETDDVAGSRLYEYEIHGEGPNELKAHFNVSPRFEPMRHHETGEKLSIPWEPDGEGIDVDFHGSNLEPDDYPRLLRRFVDGLAREAGEHVRTDYFDGPHPASNLYSYERYVRLTRDMGSKLVRTSGIFWRVFQLLADEKGSRWEFHGDNEDVVGKMHRLLLYRESIGQLFAGHRYGKQLKHYHMKNPNAQEGPTRHPKFGVLVNKKLADGTIAWYDRDDARREIDETIINLLEWANVPVKTDTGTFVADKHFAAVDADEDVARYEDPTPEIEAQQDAILVHVLQDTTECARDVVQALADGGMHYQDVADRTGWSVSAIYRALDELGELAVSDDGHLDLTSEYLRQQVAAIAEKTERVVESAAEHAARLVYMGRQREGDSAVARWAAEYAAEISRATDSDDRGRIRLDTVLSEIRASAEPRIRDVLEEGYRAWCEDGYDPREYRHMIIEAEVDGQDVRKRVGAFLPRLVG